MTDDRKVKSHADKFADSFTAPYRTIYNDLHMGLFFPVMGHWVQGTGFSLTNNDLVNGSNYHVGAVILRCLSRIHSEALSVTVTYKKAKRTMWQKVLYNDREYWDPMYADDGTSTVVVEIPPYSDRGSVHAGDIGNAYGIVDVSVSTDHDDFPNGMPGDSFEVCISGSPTVLLGVALGERWEQHKKAIEDAFLGRFVHLKPCATCEGSGEESTHGGTSQCPICKGEGTVAGDFTCPNCNGKATVCPTCYGSGLDEQTAKLFYLSQRAKDLNARKKAADEDPKLTSMRAWSRHWFVHPTPSEIKRAAAFFTGCREEDVFIEERFDPHEPTFFIFVPYFGGPLNLFSFGNEKRNDLIEWAETIRPVGTNVVTGIYYPVLEDVAGDIKDTWEDDAPFDQQAKLTIEDSPFGLYGEEVGLPVMMSLDSGQQGTEHDDFLFEVPPREPVQGTWSPVITVTPTPTVTYNSLQWPDAYSRLISPARTFGSFYFYFRHPETHISFQFVLHHNTGEQILFTATRQTGGYYDGRYTFSAPFDGFVDKFEEIPSDPNHPYVLNLASGQWLYVFVRFDTNRKKFWVTLICLDDPANPVSTSMVLTSVIDAVPAFDQLESIEIRDGGGSGNGYISEFCLFDGDLT